MRKIIFLVFIAGMIFNPLTSIAGDDLSVHNAWVRSAPPNAKVLAAYMIITNGSKEPRALTGASSSMSGKVEIHKTEMNGDMMRMIPQKRIDLPAGGSVTFEPGGYHLMLMEPKSVPKSGEYVDIELVFDNGRKLDVNVPVREGESKNKMPGMTHHN